MTPDDFSEVLRSFGPLDCFESRGFTNATPFKGVLFWINSTIVHSEWNPSSPESLIHCIIGPLVSQTRQYQKLNSINPIIQT
jgi:hypothetical protein